MSGAVSNHNAVKAILDSIKDETFQSHFSPKNMSIKVSVQAIIDEQPIVFQGSIGNAGNQGGDHLQGGRGFAGKAGFTVMMRRAKTG
ncbi:MAG: hypothetical protein OXD47_07185 [Gammaproteobacteria bacterium]|nr:hypothetical protein [Gammaproteobacteria bacterium]MCY4281722.1 hypothetical protein [Gammaproteobacteria bacterium]MCY4338571.1 hypothetical protein [Gammaproteobacteria bacterium]